MTGALAGVLVLGGLLACSTTTGQARPDPLATYYGQQLVWGSCAGMGLSEQAMAKNLQCAKVTVPIDYDHPDGPTAQIAVSRARATGTKTGSLLTNPGGPGGSGLWLAGAAAGTPVAEHFDVIGFDPRGIGASTPKIECLTDAEHDAVRADLDVDMSPAGIATTEQENKDYVAKCEQRSGAQLLAHVGTREVVRDMDIIRAALGDEKLTYLGYSYGTRIGATYAETFPTHVRAMVLDGAVNPAEDVVMQSIEQTASFQHAFDDFAAECVRHADCPFGTDPASATMTYHRLVLPLIDRPAATTDPRGLGYNDAVTATIAALYSPQAWPTLATGLTELGHGRGDTLLALADMYDSRRPDGTYDNQDDAQTAVRCVDDPRVTDRAVVGQADTEARVAAPFLDDGRGTGMAPLGPCAFWPAPVTAPPPHRIDVAGLPNVVVVSTTGDPATPYQAGVELADQLRGSLITFQGSQHTVAFDGTSKCVDNALVDYLVDLSAPPAGLSCAPDQA